MSTSIPNQANNSEPIFGMASVDRGRRLSATEPNSDRENVRLLDS